MASEDTGTSVLRPRLWVSSEVDSAPELADDGRARLLPNYTPRGRGGAEEPHWAAELGARKQVPS